MKQSFVQYPLLKVIVCLLYEPVLRLERRFSVIMLMLMLGVCHWNAGIRRLHRKAGARGAADMAGDRSAFAVDIFAESAGNARRLALNPLFEFSGRPFFH